MRVSATILDAFRRWRQYDYVTLGELEAQIRKEYRTTPDMERGTALHAVMEDPEPYRWGWELIYGDWRFAAAEIDELRGKVSSAVTEIPASFELAGHTIRCRVDGMTGLTVQELKCPRKQSYDPDNYLESYQWRIYLLAFEAQTCDYHLVSLHKPDKSSGVSYIQSHNVVRTHRYAGLEADVKRLLQDFEQFLWDRNLETYLE